MELLECLNFLKKNGIDVAKTHPLEGRLVHFPAVLKANTLEHKTEKGLVKVAHCEKYFDKALKELSGNGPLLAQEMVSGIELILGIQSDETFGKVVMAGTGGVFTEILKDVAFRAVPLTKSDAEDMVRELKIYEVLKGYRGKTYNIDALVGAIMCLSKIAEKSDIKSLDINPFILNDKRGVAVDCRIF
ncbi:MAG: acetate--CoA ligase family protein [Candidatus Aenigmatarchaeota archaeon]